MMILRIRTSDQTVRLHDASDRVVQMFHFPGDASLPHNELAIAVELVLNEDGTSWQSASHLTSYYDVESVEVLSGAGEWVPFQ